MWVRYRLPPASPAPRQREAAGEMDIEDINVFIGIDVGKMDYWATPLNRAGRKVPDKPLNRTGLCGG